MSELKTFTRPGAPTTLKRRFVDPSYMRKLFEVYFMNDEPLPPDVQSDVDCAIADMASDYDVVIAADFGHGLDRSIVDRCADCRNRGSWP